jgi:hypothetical protein
MPAGDGTLRGLRFSPDRGVRRIHDSVILRPNFTRCGFINRRLPIINHLVRTVIEGHRSARDHLEHREIPWRYYHSTKLLG